MPKAYFGTKLSSNITRTPENYIVCMNVPVARTGWQEYLARELGLDGDKIIPVYRNEEEVFSPATIASFEGKVVTDEHPNEDVNTNNYQTFLKGTCQNVRRGSGEDSDKLLADLLIYDPVLINEIEAGKREVSCGYNCLYVELEDGKCEQKNILGNHVAVVTKGRAGTEVAIRDSVPKTKKIDGGKKRMAKFKNDDRKTILARMFTAFVKDENVDPDDVAAAMDAMGESPDEPKVKDEEPEVKVADEGETSAITQLAEKIDSLISVIQQLVESDKKVHEVNPMDALETELTKGANDAEGEESVTVSPEDIQDAEPEEEEKPTTDSKMLVDIVKKMKPVIAGIKDPAERKNATDAFVKSVRSYMTPVKDSKKNNGYANIMKDMQTNAVKKTNDSSMVDDAEIGKKIMAQYNKHYQVKNGVGGKN